MEADCPDVIGGAKVVCYSVIDARHHHTGKTRHIAGGTLLGSAAALAICQYEDADDYYLFGCNEAWLSLSDTWHQSIEEAQAQAEFEYEGISRTWRFKS